MKIQTVDLVGLIIYLYCEHGLQIRVVGSKARIINPRHPGADAVIILFVNLLMRNF
jgi:hypothetical protein